ncbi:hypothetical protein ACFLZF_00490 [Nanoarchaeota archaeon]
MAKKLTQEETETIKLKEGKRKQSLENLKVSDLWDYSLPKLVTSSQFGQLSELAKSKYDETLKKTPSQNIWEQLFLPTLSSGKGVINSPYIQETSVSILQESIASIKMEDVMKYLNSNKSIKGEYKGKYVGEIKDEKIAPEVFGTYMSKAIEGKLNEILGYSTQKQISELEGVICEPEKAANNQDYRINRKAANNSDYTTNKGQKKAS